MGGASHGTGSIARGEAHLFSMGEVCAMSKRAEATDQDLEQLTVLFKLLSDKTRLNILMLLTDGERNVTGLCEELGLPQPTVSHHLGLLRMNNVIGNRREGKQVFYGLNGRVGASDRATAFQIGVQNFVIRIAAK
jgi:DNA-binding transcriptional ArsR family regulator